MTTTSPPRPFGAKIKPFDAREIKYSYQPPPKAVDWHTPAMIPKEIRSPVEDQGAMGSCVAQAVTSALETAATLRNLPVPPLSRMLTYWLGRELRGWADRHDRSKCVDSGMYLADGCDVCLGGMARESLWPYTANWSDPPPAGIESDMPNQDPLLAHRPIYVGTGAADAMFAALAEGKPIIIGWIITGEMYDPGGAPYREGLRPNPEGQHGYHCSWVYGAKQRGGKRYFYGRNSWNADWNAGIEGWDSDCEPGDFVFPVEWVERPDSMVFEIRVIDAEAFVPDPEPEPLPEEGYSEGYSDRAAQEEEFLRWLAMFYQDRQSEWDDNALRIVQFIAEQMEGFTPPQAGPRFGVPPTMTGGQAT